jgi:hypothetical protein
MKARRTKKPQFSAAELASIEASLRSGDQTRLAIALPLARKACLFKALRSKLAATACGGTRRR